MGEPSERQRLRTSLELLSRPPSRGLSSVRLMFKKLVAGNLALGAKLAIAGEEDERSCRAIYFVEHSLRITGLVEIILVGNGDERGLAVFNRAIPVMSNSRLARINEKLDTVLACRGRDAFVWR